jgi:hypothetical protein
VPGGAAVAVALAAARAAGDPDHPEKSVPALLDAIAAMDLAGKDPWVAIKRAEALDLIRNCLGLWLDATVEDPTATPGSEVKVSLTAINRSPMLATLVRVEPDGGGPLDVDATLADNVPTDRELTMHIPADAPPTQPYWLVAPPDGGAYHVGDQRLIGLPRAEPPVQVTFILKIDGRELRYRVPVVDRWTDPVRGEQSRPLEITPPVLLNLDRGVVLFPTASARDVTVRVKARAPGVAGTLRLGLPPGFAAAPEAQRFDVASKGGEAAVRFTVTPPAGATVGTLTAVATVAGREYSRAIAAIDYPHIPIQTVLPPAEAKLVRADVKIDGKRVGYVMGPGDDVPEALRQTGYEVELLGDEALDGGNLSRFDAIVVGVRAYDTREALGRDQGRLLAYVEAGGSLVVQYNTTRGLINDHLGPYPIELSHDRVTDETAPVALLVPDHPLFSSPNHITSADFDGWIQERGLYFPHTWDVHYQAPLAMADPGEPASKGALLFTTYGKGTFVYTGLSFFRQLPAGVPGAYRLFANLIAGGRAGG